MHFAIVTEAEHTADIAEWFSTCHPDRVSYEVVPLDGEKVRAAVDDLGIVGEGRRPYDHHGGYGAASKIFLPDILEHHKRVIFIDTDVIVNRPVAQLWREFSHFTDQTLFAITNISSRQAGAEAQAEDKDQYRMCSCLMLLDLEHMRSVGCCHMRTCLLSLPVPGLARTSGPGNVLISNCCVCGL